jgi:hypothetical protein
MSPQSRLIWLTEHIFDSLAKSTIWHPFFKFIKTHSHIPQFITTLIIYLSALISFRSKFMALESPFSP